jgi:hypothetical protein
MECIDLTLQAVLFPQISLIFSFKKIRISEICGKKHRLQHQKCRYARFLKTVEMQRFFNINATCVFV